jgi:hypothetical protein
MAMPTKREEDAHQKKKKKKKGREKKIGDTHLGFDESSFFWLMLMMLLYC